MFIWHYEGLNSKKWKICHRGIKAEQDSTNVILPPPQFTYSIDVLSNFNIYSMFKFLEQKPFIF